MLYNIRKIRQENCMTQDELAKKANISRATIIEIGKWRRDGGKN